jgi:hypothetical protein
LWWFKGEREWTASRTILKKRGIPYSLSSMQFLSVAMGANTST